MRHVAKWIMIAGAIWFGCSALIVARRLFWNQIPESLGLLIFFGYWCAGPALVFGGLFLLACAGSPK